VKRIAITTAAVLLGSVIGWDAVEFASGYNAFPLLIGFFPASVFLFALMAFATCGGVCTILFLLFRRQLRYASTLAAAMLACWVLSPWFVGRHAFLLGFAMRLRQVSSPAEIRLVAQTCLSHTPTKPVFGRLRGYVYAPGKMIASDAAEAEQSRRVWEMISEHPFVHLDGDTCVIFVQPPVITFVWGGALPGHWGISVAGAAEPYPQTIPFSDDIILFRGQ
jgi:hypothetical protein